MILIIQMPEFWYHKSTVKLREQSRQPECQLGYIIKQKSEVCCTGRDLHTNPNWLCVKHACTDTVSLPLVTQIDWEMENMFANYQFIACSNLYSTNISCNSAFSLAIPSPANFRLYMTVSSFFMLTLLFLPRNKSSKASLLLTQNHLNHQLVLTCFRFASKRKASYIHCKTVLSIKSTRSFIKQKCSLHNFNFCEWS